MQNKSEKRNLWIGIKFLAIAFTLLSFGCLTVTIIKLCSHSIDLSYEGAKFLFFTFEPFYPLFGGTIALFSLYWFIRQTQTLIEANKVQILLSHGNVRFELFYQTIKSFEDHQYNVCYSFLLHNSDRFLKDFLLKKVTVFTDDEYRKCIDDIFFQNKKLLEILSSYEKIGKLEDITPRLEGLLNILVEVNLSSDNWQTKFTEYIQQKIGNNKK